MTLFADLKDLTRVEKGVALIFGQGTIHTKAVKFASWPNNVGFSYTQAECVTRNLNVSMGLQLGGFHSPRIFCLQIVLSFCEKNTQSHESSLYLLQFYFLDWIKSLVALLRVRFIDKILTVFWPSELVALFMQCPCVTTDITFSKS